VVTVDPLNMEQRIIGPPKLKGLVVRLLHCYGTSTDALEGDVDAEGRGGQGPIWAVAPLDGWMGVWMNGRMAG
jgi:hypothetical protein